MVCVAHWYLHSKDGNITSVRQTQPVAHVSYFFRRAWSLLHLVGALALKIGARAVQEDLRWLKEDGGITHVNVVMGQGSLVSQMDWNADRGCDQVACHVHAAEYIEGEVGGQIGWLLYVGLVWNVDMGVAQVTELVAVYIDATRKGFFQEDLAGGWERCTSQCDFDGGQESPVKSLAFGMPHDQHVKPLVNLACCSKCQASGD